MKFTIKTLSLIIIAISLAACGDPKFDGSSDESMKESLEKILVELPDEKKKDFKKAIAGIYVMGGLKAKGSGKSKAEVQAEITSELDGKTADEIIAIAEKI